MRRNLVVLILAALIVVFSSPARAEQLGVPIPAPLASTSTQGGAPNFADTFVTPYVATKAGTILTWKTQFVGGYLDGTTTPGVPAGVQTEDLPACAFEYGGGGCRRRCGSRSEAGASKPVRRLISILHGRRLGAC